MGKTQFVTGGVETLGAVGVHLIGPLAIKVCMACYPNLFSIGHSESPSDIGHYLMSQIMEKFGKNFDFSDIFPLFQQRKEMAKCDSSNKRWC